MNIPKEQILDLLRNRGDDAKATQAEAELPDQVDPNDAGHTSLLAKLGLNPADLLGGGGLGNLGGKLGL